MALPPGRFGSIRKIYGHGLLKTSLENRSKICPDSSKYVRTVQDVSGQFKMFPDSSNYVRTAQNVSGQVKSFVQTTQNMSGQPKMCPDTSRCVRTVQDMSRQFKMCPDSSKYGRSRKMITHFLGMSRKTYAFFVRKIFGCHPEDIRFLGLWGLVPLNLQTKEMTPYPPLKLFQTRPSKMEI